jgi:hypothetical protein
LTDPRFIGLSGYARSGKDTVADILFGFGYERITFAGKLKEAVKQLDPILGVQTFNEAQDAGWELEAYLDQPPYIRVSDALYQFTPDEIKARFPEYRLLLQRMGTEVGRNLFSENFWVDIAFAGLDVNEKYVITDARFPNEFDAVKAHAGEMWRIQRPGTGPVNNHPSETSLDDHDFDRIVVNDGTITDLALAVEMALAKVSV